MPYSDSEKEMETATFSFDRVTSNVKLLAGLLVGHETMDYVLSIYQKFAGECDIIASALSIEKLLQQEDCSARNGGVIAYSHSHSTTFHLISDVKKRAEDIKIGVLCLDAHADVYETHQPLWKGNVFSHLLESGLIEVLVLFGVPAFRHGIIFETIPRFKTQVVFVSHLLSAMEMCTVFEDIFFKNKVTHLFISIDVDGLDTQLQKYTAMEYCEFSVLKNLDYTLPGNLKEKTAQEIVRDAVWPKNPDGTVRNLKDFGIGISTEDVRRVISIVQNYAQMKGIKLGIPAGERQILGDIVELCGMDVGGRTAQAVHLLTSQIVTV
ncbi:MAG: hypothetical protein A3B74_01255 [Candidatus Kerfeldbacteria bacterium RIFCSPHIGHO2_02_FULL_42_14]|uniref:Arginase n=1 Tax=Candidatus Kerfeldbacteria bacterium RIFCSPHIGHO2_02_FULL_42_14 TaxID=1798540 RepID=A0A1G2AN79_9BACT|nr:MAG: hypothetical protein A3B74_01255 [Candidatus Kerfeldbacteria bacterium RIFCSPHIGHO2_02_FULL_42_14]